MDRPKILDTSPCRSHVLEVAALADHFVNAEPTELYALRRPNAIGVIERDGGEDEIKIKA